ncbi:tumor protein p53-inducible nuclear protein 2-like [Amphibalanus amphitrite]|uniref:tumor protein p53-inducible nuclear protein 2-like n=1 Tax=Amphibalanus amphitrite TaxID=1232801 RepID=UPI001C8FCF0D|nr:tumor protein p53-inducible nuclear protein 2-like [Amphibalanus amphitrite]
MLGHLSGYLFGNSEGTEAPAAAAPETVTPCRELHIDDPELDEWVMVAEGATPGATPGVTPACSTSPSTPTSQLTVDDNWTLTPPACFGGRAPLPPASSLENLLIEHPSMSVYVRGGRPAPPAPAAATDRTPSPPAAAPVPRPSAAARRAAHAASQPVPAAQLQRLAVQQAQKHANRSAQRQLRPAALERANLARHVAAGGNQRQRRQHHYTTRHSGANNNRKC